MVFPPVPPEIKSLAHLLKVADEHEDRNIVVSYWGRMYACQSAMKLLPGKKPPEVSKLLVALMDWLEETKTTRPDVEGITNETVAQSVIEQYALQLFTYADAQDRAENFSKNVIKAFYTAGILMDMLEQFGELSEDIASKRKYAKWKAAYIHNCLKSGEPPIPGGPNEHLNNVIDMTKIDNNEDGDGEGGSFDAPPADPAIGHPGVTSPGYSFHSGPSFSPYPATPGSSGSEPPAFTPISHTPPVQPQPPPLFPSNPAPSSSTSSLASVDPEAIQKAQKFCKFASSALNYDDTKAAVENLQKALNLLTLGREN